MRRYIDAEKLKRDMAYECLLKGEFNLITALDIINAVPTADVVEVTRCKYCKFYRPYNKPVEDFDGRCLARECETDEYDFCNYGEEKGSEGK